MTDKARSPETLDRLAAEARSLAEAQALSQLADRLRGYGGQEAPKSVRTPICPN